MKGLRFFLTLGLLFLFALPTVLLAQNMAADADAHRSFVQGLTPYVNADVISFFVGVFGILFGLSELRKSRLRHWLKLVWDTIIETDLLFGDQSHPEVRSYMDKHNYNLKKAKKQYTISKIMLEPPEKVNKILKYFGSISRAVEDSFLFFKYGKRLKDLVLK